MNKPMRQELESLQTKLALRIDNNELTFPRLPSIATDVLSLVSDKDTDSKKLADLIQSDQFLASHVMRMANSALYSPNTPLKTLQQAIVRLGMGKLAEITIAASMDNNRFEAPGFEQLTTYLWEHSLQTALWGKEIARAIRKNVEATFLAGLLHTIGKPVVLKSAIEIACELSITVAEDDVCLLFDKFHQTIGLKLAKEWKLPEAVEETIRCIDDYSKTDKYRELVMIVSAADYFSSFSLGRLSMGADAFKALTVFGELNLYDEDLELLLEKEANIKSAINAFKS